MLGVPADLSAITADWMTEALSARLRGVVVAAVTVGTVEHGTNSRARVRVSYGSGTGPASVFVKGPGRLGHRAALGVLGAVGTEALLAEADARLPATHPRLYAGGVDRRRLAAVVVMDDVVAAGGRPNEGTRPLPVPEVADGLAGLARLHAAYWEGRMPPSLGFLRPWRLGRLWTAVSVASLARGRRRLRASGLSWGVRIPPPHALGRQFRASTALAASGPRTLLHGDPHPGNTYASAAGATGFYDWQLARTGHWSHDVGYFLVSSLGVEDRRRHEEGLLAGYLDELGAAGAPVPPWSSAWQRYRATPAFGLATWVHTLSFGTFQRAAVCLATIERFAAAYEDLGSATSEVAT